MSTRTGSHNPRLAIKAARQLRQQTQQDLADALTRETGDNWSRGMVANLEAGDKLLTIDILQAVVHIQDLPWSFYLEGPNGDMGAYLSSFEPAAA